MRPVTQYFGENVFNERVMKSRLPMETFKLVQLAIHNNKRLDSETAAIVANAMKDWALEKGATHYTHWFQPMTGITAEKHDSFISPTAGGKVIMEFSGKELIQGETDASSFPSGGLRATFEARGYTAWDPTSFAFIKSGVLCIPTAFCSYGGEALDKKTPLLRSMEAINKQALRVLKLFGNEDVTAVKTTVGPEQEYFLIDKETYLARKDLLYTGRTLYGAMPPKGQELDYHYFGTIKTRVKNFMTEVDEELWKLGVLSKTEHNEAAPAQHELAPIFATTNIAVDHNQITMEVLQRTAKKHDLICLLHEKPFEGVNGSGKHNNWSISTNTGVNLLNPGETPYENAQFLLFLCAVIEAVDEYQDLLRISVATAGNDRRLGALEAPPAIVSMFLGDELEGILDCIESDRPYGAKEKENLKVGVHVLPKFPKDTTDRNRTAPFAFTGNKFEFRMLGSSDSVAEPNVVLNTAAADALSRFADELEAAEDFETALHDLIQNTIRKHKKIIWGGNCYDENWAKEAEKRGLLNLKTTPDCLPLLLAPKNVELFARHKVYTETELKSRLEIMLENYCKIVNIEALTMIDMARKDILPAVSDYITTLSDAVSAGNVLELDMRDSFEFKTARELSALKAEAFRSLTSLEKATSEAAKIANYADRSIFYKENILTVMEELRASVDKMETLTAADFWPMPTYGDLLFGVM
ncbi:MAG: glutamine synthetase III [Clostridia bacterium]|nr:glutamine synthetase III [Clostridia bacterium]